MDRKFLPTKHALQNSNLSNPVKGGAVARTLIPSAHSRDSKGLRARWLASLAEWANSRLSERPYLMRVKLESD